ncbi:MAG TPA: hypothetical protein DD719_05525 [Desulfotomaculum sp.]|jgi:hypothetical protein|nr:hypothetical protein [Desulfotomaculum sp.]
MKFQSKQKISYLLSLILLLVSLNPFPAAALNMQPKASRVPAGTKVLVNGAPLALDVAPLVEQGRLLIPLRAIAEALGAVVKWKEAGESIMVTKGEVSVRLKIGSNTAYKNNIKINLEAPLRITGGRTLAPLRLVSETLGAKVAWEENSRKVIITYIVPASHQDMAEEVTVNLLTANQADVEKDLSDLLFWSFQNRHEAVRDTTVAKQDNSSARIKSLYSGNQDMSIRTLPTMINISPAKPYIFNVWAKADAAPTRQWRIGVRWYDANNNFISSNDSTNIDVTSDWSELVIAGTSPKNAAKCYGTLVIINAACNEIFWWDKAQFAGSKRTF